ncbi:hypothetical protein TNCV_2823281 [Trichonephila clavipes]|nr:hypothetical protein TNCV_2823281 [Trichonephila clavipes]
MLPGLGERTPNRKVGKLTNRRGADASFIRRDSKSPSCRGVNGEKVHHSTVFHVDKGFTSIPRVALERDVN